MQLLLSENYFALLLLGGLLTLMLAYRDVPLPGAGNFRLILAVLFLMCVSTSAEHWAQPVHSRTAIRVAASVAHYILQPLVIFLELMMIQPEDDTGGETKILSGHHTPQRQKSGSFRSDSGQAAVHRRRILSALPLMINTLIYLSAPFTGALVFRFENGHFHRGPLGGSVYIVTFLYLVMLLYRSVRSFRENDRRKSIFLFFIASIALITGILEGLDILTGYIDEAFLLSFFLYFMYLITVHETRLRSSLADSELELSRSRVRLLREQIRPHFIFNSLQIIRSLIRTDQSKAVRSLEDFSDYLRANIDAIRSDRLVPFSAELEHVKAYVSLALADESKNTEVLYDIRETDFHLPPLTVEPLVENAILHGIAKNGGGTVLLSSRAEDGTFVITVSDNGNGFRQSGTDREEKRTGVGIENVRKRLALQCNGTLDIESGTSGTVVTMRLPAGSVTRPGEHAPRNTQTSGFPEERRASCESPDRGR